VAIETYTEQLERVQGLIKAIEASSNASTTILGRQFTKHDLKDLYAREKELRALVAREAGGGKIKVRQVVPL
jgi:hypothetical protein